MDLSKIKQLHIAIIGIVLIAIAEALILFMMWKPQHAKYLAAKARYDAAAATGNQASLEAAKQDVKKAEQSVKDALNNLDAQMRRRMPVLDFTKRDVGMIAMWYEQITKMGPLLESFANDPNVDVYPVSFSLPAPPASPNDPLFDSEVLNFQLGSVSATGDFRSLMNHVRRWNNCRRLVLVDGVALSGNSPNLTVSYTLQCYVFPLATGGKTNPMWGAATAGGGMGPGGGGMMGPGMGGGMMGPGMAPGAKSGMGAGMPPGAGGPMPGAGMGPGMMGPGAKGGMGTGMGPGAGGPMPGAGMGAGMPRTGMGPGPGMPGAGMAPGVKAGMD